MIEEKLVFDEDGADWVGDVAGPMEGLSEVREEDHFNVGKVWVGAEEIVGGVQGSE